MKRHKVLVSALAKADVREACKWYHQQQTGLARRFTSDMAATLRKIAMNPTSFALRYNKIRLANFDVFPYAAHFYIDEDDGAVFVIAILHSSRQHQGGSERV